MTIYIIMDKAQNIWAATTDSRTGLDKMLELEHTYGGNAGGSFRMLMVEDEKDLQGSER